MIGRPGSRMASVDAVLVMLISDTDQLFLHETPCLAQQSRAGSDRVPDASAPGARTRAGVIEVHISVFRERDDQQRAQLSRERH